MFQFTLINDKFNSLFKYPAARHLNEFSSTVLNTTYKILFLALLCIVPTFCQNPTPEIILADTQEIQYALSMNKEYLYREYKGVKIHKALAYTTGVLLLASDAMGIYHFLSMKDQGHKYRDSNGYSEDNTDAQAQSNEIKTIWRSRESQMERLIHTGLISASTICYAATATIELSLPRMDTDPSRFSRPAIHRNLFFCHAALMAANIGLGMAESYALSQGNHNLVMGLGISHMVIGIAAPVVMFGSGLVFSY